MALIAVGDRVLVTIAGSLCGQRTLTTFLYRISAVGANLEYADAMAALRSSLQGSGQLVPKYKACCPTNWFSNSLWTQIIRPLRYRKLVEVLSGAGTSGSLALTGNVQGSITRAGEVAGRKYVGGVRVPCGTDEIAIDEGFLTSGQKLALQGLADAMQLNVITSGSVATYIPQVGVPKPPDQSADLYTAFPQDQARVIRRRTVGLGI